MGSLVKRLLASRLGCGSNPSRLYHATVMPCYDKKLEASRDELTVNGLPEVCCEVRKTPCISVILFFSAHSHCTDGPSQRWIAA